MCYSKQKKSSFPVVTQIRNHKVACKRRKNRTRGRERESTLTYFMVTWGLFDRASSSWNKVNANLVQLGNFIDVFLARHVSSKYAHHQENLMLSCSIWFSAPSFWMGGGASRTAPSAPYTRPTQRLPRQPPIHKLCAENQMLQLNIYCSWWWAYLPETFRAKNTSIFKLPGCIKLAFNFIS